MNALTDPLVGSTFAGNFEILELIGIGGMGRVYKAHQTHLDRIVAIKMMKVPVGKDPSWVQRFLREAKATSRINHPSCVHIHDCGEDKATSVQYIVMEFVEGMTAQSLVMRRGPLPAPQVVHIGTRVLSALQAAHEASVIHRDIKPSNVILTTEGHVKVCDFGIAKILDDGADAERLLTLTKTGMVLGTFAYMSPEQARGEPVGPRSDVFSCGATLYKLLTGKRPFRGDTPGAMLNALVTRDPAPMVGPDGPIDPNLDAIIRRSMARSLDERYRSARSMEKALIRYMRGEGAKAKPPELDATVIDRPDRQGPDTPSSPMPTPGSVSLFATSAPQVPAIVAAAPTPAPNRLAYVFGAVALAAIAALAFVQLRGPPSRTPGDPLVEMSALVSSGGYGPAETYFLERFDELKDRHDAAVLAKVLLGMRREAERHVAGAPKWNADVRLVPVRFTGSVSLRGRAESEIMAIVIDDVREATFSGSIALPGRRVAMSIAGLHDGNHVLFWDVALVQGAERPYPRREKFSAFVDADQLVLVESTYFDRIRLSRTVL